MRGEFIFTIGQLQCILAPQWTSSLYDVIFWCVIDTNFVYVSGKGVSFFCHLYTSNQIDKTYPLFVKNTVIVL